ncbi:MAG: Smr/MutS family protein [Gemmatimonadota bacterium]|nr:Smr/MutS family protein [Gemmatimonadota bacterium]
MLSDPLLDVTPVATLDLHGLTRVEAERAVRALVATWRRRQPGAVLHVITGRGRGSAGRPALRPAVRRLLVGPLAGEIADWARDLDEGGFLVQVR